MSLGRVHRRSAWIVSHVRLSDRLDIVGGRIGVVCDWGGDDHPSRDLT